MRCQYNAFFFLKNVHTMSWGVTFYKKKIWGVTE